MKYLGRLRRKIPNFTSFADVFLKKGMFLFAGLLASRAVIAGGFAPFGVALVAAAPPGYIVYTMAGAMFGYFFSGGIGVLRYAAALIAAAGIRWALCDLKAVSRHKAFPSVNAFVSVTFTAVILTASVGKVGLEELLLFFAEGLLAAGSAYFFDCAIALTTKRSPIASMGMQELCSVVISYGIMLVSLTRIEFFSISIGRAVMIFSVLLAARYAREAGGAIAGIAAGTIMSLVDPGLTFLAGAYAFGGLLAGTFSRFGRIASSFAFAASAAVITINGGIDMIVPVTVEIGIAAAVFSLLPSRLTDRLARGLSPSAVIPHADAIRRAVLGRLENASGALSDISGVIGEVSEKLSKLSASDLSEVFNLSSEEICKECGLRACCWKTCISDIKSAFQEMSAPLTEKGRIELDELPEYIKKKCAHPNELMLTVNRNYSDYVARESAKRKVAGVRAVINDQFEGMSELLQDIVKEIENFQRDDQDSAERLKAALKTEGYTPVEVCCRLDSARRMSVEIHALCFGRETEHEELNELVCSACGREFEPPLIERRGDEFKLRTTERVTYTAEFGAAQHVCNNGRLCGDAYECYRDGKGKAVILLSDGMGSGGQAAVDSGLASTLMSRLLKGGFSFDCALKIVNSAMLVKSDDETLATLDIACLDLYSGKAEFLKAGAPLTLIRRGNRIIRVDTASLPTGILREISFERSLQPMDDGDVILMFSDGAIVGSTRWLEQELMEYKNENPPQEFCEHLLEQVANRRAGGHDDDVTIIAAVIRRRDDEEPVMERSA